MNKSIHIRINTMMLSALLHGIDFFLSIFFLNSHILSLFCNDQLYRRRIMLQFQNYFHSHQYSLIYNLYKYLFLFLVGGFTYFYIEIIYRGYSHFSMIICGGLAILLCGGLNQLTHFQLSLIAQMLLSSFIITGLEFITGYIVNIRLGLNVWDYSDMPYNLYGQICLSFSLLWLLLSLPCIFLDDLIRWKIFDEKKPLYRWW